MAFEHISAEVRLFIILYCITGVMPLMAALYLLLRQGNAFAADVIPPLRLRRWAAAFFAVAALGHVWWYLLYIYSLDPHSVGYVAVAVLDCVGLLTTAVGTLFAMLQDRERPVWLAFVALIPFAVMIGVHMVSQSDRILQIAVAYVLLLYVLFSVYIAFAVRRYGRWLRDNYADLERKEVWLTHVLSLVFMLLFILYIFVDIDTVLIYLLHFVELVLFGLLLWRVETLPQLSTPLPNRKEVGTKAVPDIKRLLAEHCVATQLYLQHNLTLQQLSQAVGTNRYYLSQYFSTCGTTYNAYINDLRINHFVRLYREAVAAGQPVVAQQLASQSGYRSYSTFGLAFKQRMGQTVTAWMRTLTPHTETDTV